MEVIPLDLFSYQNIILVLGFLNSSFEDIIVVVKVGCEGFTYP